jgi:hypothetical protein
MDVSNNSDFLSQQLMWIMIYLGITLTISFIVPFPYSLPMIIGVVIILSFLVRRRMTARMGGSGTSMFRSSGSRGLLRRAVLSIMKLHVQNAALK